MFNRGSYTLPHAMNTAEEKIGFMRALLFELDAAERGELVRLATPPKRRLDLLTQDDDRDIEHVVIRPRSPRPTRVQRVLRSVSKKLYFAFFSSLSGKTFCSSPASGFPKIFPSCFLIFFSQKKILCVGDSK